MVDLVTQKEKLADELLGRSNVSQRINLGDIPALIKVSAQSQKIDGLPVVNADTDNLLDFDDKLAVLGDAKTLQEANVAARTDYAKWLKNIAAQTKSVVAGTEQLLDEVIEQKPINEDTRSDRAAVKKDATTFAKAKESYLDNRERLLQEARNAYKAFDPSKHGESWQDRKDCRAYSNSLSNSLPKILIKIEELSREADKQVFSAEVTLGEIDTAIKNVQQQQAKAEKIAQLAAEAAAAAERDEKIQHADYMHEVVLYSMKIPSAKTFDAPSLDQFRGFTLNGENDTAVCRALQTAETNLFFSPDKQHTQDLKAIGHFKNVYDLQDGGAIAQAAKQEYCEEIAAIIQKAATVTVDDKAPVQTVSARGIRNGLDAIATNSDKAGAAVAQIYMSTEAAARNLTEYHKALLEKTAWDESKTVASQLVALQDFRESTGTQVGGETHNAYVKLVEQKVEAQKGELLDEKAPLLLARDVNVRVEQMNQQERALEERLAQLERDKERQRRINELTTLPEMHPHLVAQLKSQIITPLPSDMPATKPDKFADPDFSSTKIKVAQDALLIRQGARDGAAKNIEDKIGNHALQTWYDDSYQAAANNRPEDIPEFPFDHYREAKAQDTSGTEIAAALMQQVAATRAALPSR